MKRSLTLIVLAVLALLLNACGGPRPPSGTLNFAIDGQPNGYEATIAILDDDGNEIEVVETEDGTGSATVPVGDYTIAAGEIFTPLAGAPVLDVIWQPTEQAIAVTLIEDETENVDITFEAYGLTDPDGDSNDGAAYDLRRATGRVTDGQLEIRLTFDTPPVLPEPGTIADSPTELAAQIEVNLDNDTNTGTTTGGLTATYCPEPHGYDLGIEYLVNALTEGRNGDGTFNMHPESGSPLLATPTVDGNTLILTVDVPFVVDSPVRLFTVVGKADGPTDCNPGNMVST